ncbi:Syntaxin 8A [Monocercomonoides exilis]|uniref:Syntaxin 8A n=1 Tax=Monocercomonoides exilis TaxID=2049356 RepID=UPI003559662D|nr:Syntaxin 8A [Monocercomonoides exilis]|eukprot:MONOS_3003.1-p1 / transcript=MONOS_3003.1 / gene=MONOS_3003 / organism=Monocercomonoides_exilis_PA203 / gene_product= Syntaxin 8A / transcript_product= Syntaxin 8A / location=Mono_scaffold00066:125077-126085(-) / protein_length=244 / sequence_SO=supercontig / SO=protein_coding / is_pseudo=false
MTKIKTSADWHAVLQNAEKSLQITSRQINERLAALNAGTAPQAYSKQHQQTRRAIDQITATADILESSISNLLNKKKVSQYDAQLMHEKFNGFRQRLSTATSKVNMSFSGPIGERTKLVDQGVRIVPLGETEETRLLTDDELAQINEQQIEAQDEVLDELHAQLSMEHMKAIEIGTELTSQDEILERVKDKVDNAESRTIDATKKAEKLRKKSGFMKYYLTILVLVAILFMQITSNNFGLGYG